MGWNDRIGLISVKCKKCGHLYHFFEDAEDEHDIAYPCPCRLAESAKVFEQECRLNAEQGDANEDDQF